MQTVTQISAPDGELLGSFLLPDGFARPALTAVLRERRVVGETRRLACATVASQVPWPRAPRATPGEDLDPVLLVPGFLAGDASLMALATGLRAAGGRTYRSRILTNVGCTAAAADLLETRLEDVADRTGSRVQIVGHSLGGLLARGLAVRRPDLVSGIVTLGSPMLAPGAHHLLLTASLGVLVRLNRVGLGGVMSKDCIGGSCAQSSFEETRAPVPAEVGFTALYSRRDGVVDWRACIDPQARVVEVSSSHVGMAVDPRVRDEVLRALQRHQAESGDAVPARRLRPVTTDPAGSRGMLRGRLRWRAGLSPRSATAG